MAPQTEPRQVTKVAPVDCTISADGSCLVRRSRNCLARDHLQDRREEKRFRSRTEPRGSPSRAERKSRGGAAKLRYCYNPQTARREAGCGGGRDGDDRARGCADWADKLMAALPGPSNFC